MKKIFLAFVSTLLFFGAQAQILMSENFDASTALPAGWAQYNVDGLIAAANIATIVGTNAWAVRANTTGNQITSTSWYTPAGTSNDWLVTPAIVLPAGTASLKYDIQAQDPDYPDGYQVYISTTGNTVADFTAPAIYTEAAAPSVYTTRFIDLAAYANTTVYIAFRNTSTDMFLLNLDNISVFVPLATDMGAMSISLPTYATNGSNVTVAGSMQNFGSDAVTSFTLNYVVDAGTPVTQDITGVNIAGLSGTYNFSATTPWVAGPVGTHTIKAWATNINGNADLNPANDEISGTVMVASQVLPRTVVIEELTSSTCAPCASLNATFDPLLTNNNTNDHTNFSNVTAIKYQMDWPSPGDDPSYNADGDARRAYYATSGIPELHIDGGDMNNSQAAIDNAKAKQTPMNIVTTAIIGGNMITVDVAVTPYVNIPSGTKLHIAVLEKQYNYTGGSTSQEEYHHIMRKMLPNGNGTDLTDLLDGVTVNKTGTYSFTIPTPPAIPAQNSYALWTAMQNLEVVAFVQNVATKEIYQSSLATISAGVKDLSKDFNINLFPNPVKNDLIVTINANKNSKATIDLYNTLGQVVVTETLSSVAAGDNTFHVNTSDLNAGIYFAKISFGTQVETIKFVVEK